ncbi:AAA-like domain-containing protein [Floridanema fluviatile]
MREVNLQDPIPFDVALKVADAAVFTQAARHLRNIEVAVLRGAWQGQKYDDIAQDCGYAPEYIKHDVGPKLWQLLSSSLGEKVSKTNLMAVLTQNADRLEKNIEETDEWKKAELEKQQSKEAEINHGIQKSQIPQILALDLDPPIGLLPLDSTFYLERPPVESRCYEEVMRSGALIRIKAPSQMGKTSLMVRILAHAKQQAADVPVNIVALSLQRADKAIFTDLDRFLRWFCTVIARKLQVLDHVDEYWSDTFGSKGNCTAYFEDCILPEINGILVLALDQVDEVFLHPEIADDFFTLLRSWYEEAAYGESGNPLWQNLRLIVVHSTEVYIPLDVNKSPFNVGLAIELKEFSENQVIDLVQRYGLNLSSAELSELMQLVSGHPFLVQQALYRLARQELTLSELLQTAPTDAGIYCNHLHRHLRSFQDYPQLATAYDRVVKTSSPVDLDQLLAFQLHSMGLVKLQGNQVIPSCELYRRYFSSRVE